MPPISPELTHAREFYWKIEDVICAHPDNVYDVHAFIIETYNSSLDVSSGTDFTALMSHYVVASGPFGVSVDGTVIGRAYGWETYRVLVDKQELLVDGKAAEIVVIGSDEYLPLAESMALSMPSDCEYCGSNENSVDYMFDPSRKHVSAHSSLGCYSGGSMLNDLGDTTSVSEVAEWFTQLIPVAYGGYDLDEVERDAVTRLTSLIEKVNALDPDIELKVLSSESESTDNAYFPDEWDTLMNLVVI